MIVACVLVNCSNMHVAPSVDKIGTKICNFSKKFSPIALTNITQLNVFPMGAHHSHKVVALQLGYFSFRYQTKTFRAGQGDPPEHVQKIS